MSLLGKRRPSLLRVADKRDIQYVLTSVLKPPLCRCAPLLNAVRSKISLHRRALARRSAAFGSGGSCRLLSLGREEFPRLPHAAGRLHRHRGTPSSPPLDGTAREV